MTVPIQVQSQLQLVKSIFYVSDMLVIVVKEQQLITFLLQKMPLLICGQQMQQTVQQVGVLQILKI